MKKVLTALAILAIAATAQAELLATWTFNLGESSVASEAGAANIEQVTFGNLTRTDGMGTPSKSGTQFSANGWDDGSLSFSVSVTEGYEIVDSVLAVTDGINGSGTGPAQLQWSLNGTDLGTAWENAGSKTAAQSLDIGTLAAGNNVLSLRSTGGTITTPTATVVGAGGSARLWSSMTFDGTIRETAAPVPEPATMSLLGLGALAMVLRRKLRK